jgi:hypothetical protein
MYNVTGTDPDPASLSSYIRDANDPDQLSVGNASQDGDGCGETFVNWPPGTYFLDISFFALGDGGQYTITAEQCEGETLAATLEAEHRPSGTSTRRISYWGPSTVRRASYVELLSGGCPYGRATLSGCRNLGASRGGTDSGTGRLEAVGYYIVSFRSRGYRQLMWRQHVIVGESQLPTFRDSLLPLRDVGIARGCAAMPKDVIRLGRHALSGASRRWGRGCMSATSACPFP